MDHRQWRMNLCCRHRVMVQGEPSTSKGNNTPLEGHLALAEEDPNILRFIEEQRQGKHLSEATTRGARKKKEEGWIMSMFVLSSLNVSEHNDS